MFLHMALLKGGGLVRVVGNMHMPSDSTKGRKRWTTVEVFRILFVG